jgi:two-component system, OmpR family, phosphate regulon response regulator PhoB
LEEASPDSPLCVRRIYGRDITLDLEPIEFRLLEYFMARPGRVFSGIQLIDGVWGLSEIDEGTADVHVGRV